MAMAYGTNSAHTSNSSNPSTLAFTTAITDKVLVLSVVTQGAARTGGGPSFAGITMTQAATTQSAAAAPETFVELFYLLDPPVTTANISIPDAGTINIYFVAMTATCAANKTCVLDSTATGNNTSVDPTSTIVTNNPGCIIFSTVGNGAATWAPSARSGTLIFDTDDGQFGDGQQYLLQTNAGSQVMGWTFGTSEDWAVVTAAFRETNASLPENYKFITVGDGMSVSERIR